MSLTLNYESLKKIVESYFMQISQLDNQIKKICLYEKIDNLLEKIHTYCISHLSDELLN
jgi:hypothetical protein